MSQTSTILVTGAAGYIGRHVVSKLLDTGARVIATDLCDTGIDSRAEIIISDIFNENSQIYDALGRPDVCLHMAWRDGFVHQSSAHIDDLPKHYHFLKNMIEGGLPQLAVMGSMHEIGYHEGSVDETTPCNPVSLYGIAKDTLRRVMLQLLANKTTVFQWLRGYYIYGDDARNHSIFTKLLEAENRGQTVFPFTSGKNLYDFISVDDLASQISACVLQDEVRGIINCCSGVPVSLADVVETFIARNNLQIRLQYGAFPDRPYDSPGIWGNSEKIQQILKNQHK